MKAEELIESFMQPHLNKINAFIIHMSAALEAIDKGHISSCNKMTSLLANQERLLNRYEMVLSVMTLAESKLDYIDTVVKRAQETQMFLEDHSFSMCTVARAHDTWRDVVSNIEDLASELYRVNKRIVAINKCIHKTEYKLSGQS